VGLILITGLIALCSFSKLTSFSRNFFSLNQSNPQMNLSLFRRVVAHLLVWSCVSVFVLGLSSCGGSGGSDGDGDATVRPKSLDGLVMKLDKNVSFEFVRNTGASGAVATGDVETGTFFYTLAGTQLRQYPNQQGDESDCRYPDRITAANYTYRAINETSAVLTLNGVGGSDLITTGSFNANNGSFAYFFESSSFRSFFGPQVINQLEIDLTFQGNGVSVTTGVSTVRIPGSALPNYDTVRIPTDFNLAGGGGAVPENYNPTVDFQRPSRITPASLNALLMRFTNGIPNPVFDFTIQFTSSASVPVGTDGTASEEIGQGLLRVAGAVVDNAVNYTWKRIPNTDTGTLTITGSNQTYDGIYTLSFSGPDSGRYAGQADGGTADANEVSGSFVTQ
jgi:hypothetical protein